MNRMDFTAYTTKDDEAGYLRESVDICPEGIREEFVRVPADLAYWGERYAEACRAALLAEADRKTVFARLTLQIRETYVERGQKPTVDQVEAWVTASPEYQAIKLAEIEAEATRIAAKCRFDAVCCKRDMIISLGATIRQEQGHVQINGRRGDGSW